MKSERRGTGLRVNKSQAAKICGISVTAFDSWIRQGAPFIEKGANGKAWVFDTAQIIAWLEEKSRGVVGEADALDKNAEQARLAKEQADKLAMENAERRGELLDQKRIGKAIEIVFVGVRSKVLSIPTKAAPQLVGIKKALEAEGLLKEFCHDALRDVSETTIVGTLGSANIDNGSNGGDGLVKKPKAATKKNNKRVGGRKKATKPRVKRRAGKVGNKPG
jgi:terminase small subunit / prophage DNA-packing protein